MEYSIEKRDKYLFVSISGVFDDGVVKSIVTDINSAVRENQYEKVAIDCRKLEGGLSIMDRYNTGVLFSQEMPIYVKCVLYAAPEHILPDKHLETVAVNRGGQVFVTADPEEMIEYLGIDEDPDVFS